MRVAGPEDIQFLAVNDHHVASRELRDLLARGRVSIATCDGDPCGWLRWNLFWDEIPFMNMLFVRSERRGLGIGRLLIEGWESARKAAGHDLVMTSTLSTEDAQHLYRHVDYRDVGHLDLPGEPREILLVHET